MRHKTLLFSITLLFITITSFSQAKKYLYYFDKDLKSSGKASAVFNGVGVYENDLFELRVYSSLNKSLVYIQHFTDSSLQASNGFFQSYYPNLSKEWEGSYLKGKEDGLWQRWDSIGRIIDSSIYSDGQKIIEVHAGYYKNGILDSFIVNKVKEGVLQKTFYDDKGTVISEVSFNGQNGLEKVYDKGVIVRSDSVHTRDEIEASFPGGIRAWSQYIANELQKSQDQLKNGDYGTCIVKFTIDIDGKITGVEATTMHDTKLAEIAVRVISHGPKWKPAMQYGRHVKAYRIQPVTVGKPN